jgi:hypothetical protein
MNRILLLHDLATVESMLAFRSKNDMQYAMLEQKRIELIERIKAL